MMPNAVLSELNQTRSKVEADIRALPDKEKSLKIQFKKVNDDLMKAKQAKEEALQLLDTAKQRLVNPRRQYQEIKSQLENIPKLNKII